MFALLVSLSIIAGCSNAEPEKTTNETQHEMTKQTSEQQKDKDKTSKSTKTNFETFFTNVPEVPKDVQGFINQHPGTLVGLPEGWKEKLDSEIENLPPLPEEPTEKQYDQYFKFIYSLVAEDFPDPSELINKLKFSSYGNPSLDDSRYTFKENYNIEIILDSSGSMAEQIDGKSRMELAKEAINQFISNAPEEANISLRVYGHKGTGKEEDKQKSCSGIEQVYGFKNYNKTEFNHALDQFEPSGWTPIAGALKESKKAFEKYDGEKNSNLIYLVSDGIETCDGDPVKVANELGNSKISPIINVIGFNVDSKAQKQLEEVAESSNGIYSTVSDGNQLSDEFKRAQKVLGKWEDWKKDSLSDADAQRVDNSFDILEYKNDWNFSGLSQGVNIYSAINELQNKGKIQFKHKKELRQRLNDVKELENQISKELDAELEELSDKNFEEIKKEINKKYNSNTKQN